MSESTFQKGDIIEYCGEFYEVDDVYSSGSGGSVHELTVDLERTGICITDWKWSAYGADCTLFRSANTAQ